MGIVNNHAITLLFNIWLMLLVSSQEEVSRLSLVTIVTLLKRFQT